MPASETLQFPLSSRPFLDPYLPPLSAPSSAEAPPPPKDEQSRPFTTLTFATSLDSALSLAPGVRTTLSGPHSKAMTHYLRFRHDAILIGVGTANADDPGLNCRIEGAGGYAHIQEDHDNDDNDHTTNENEKGNGKDPSDPIIQALAEEASTQPDLKELMKVVGSSQASAAQLQLFQEHIDRITNTQNETIRQQQETLHQPRPIVVDPKARWGLHQHSKIIELVKQGKGKAPFVLISKKMSPPRRIREMLEKYGGKYIPLDTSPAESTPANDDDDDDNDAAQQHFDWTTILSTLYKQENIKSLMIEGGGSIINSLLSEQRYSGLVDSVIVTIAPTWLGQGGVVVSPNRRVDEDGCAVPASRLTDVKWCPFGEDVVLCGRILGS